MSKLYRLLYRSEAALVGATAHLGDQVEAIAVAAAARNLVAEITGAMVFVQGGFIQVLEGSLQPLEATFERICRDTRHRQVSLIEFRPIDERAFGDWSMALIAPGREVGSLLPTIQSTSHVTGSTSAQAMVELLRAHLVGGEGRKQDAGRDAATGQAARNPRILVVDDVVDNRSILRRRLVKRGYEVIEAKDGEDALIHLAHDTAFEAVLLDIMMPGISGIDVLTEIRRHRSPEELPVIMVTGKSFSSDIDEAMRLGANDYITKPVDFTSLMMCLTSYREQKPSLAVG